MNPISAILDVLNGHKKQHFNCVPRPNWDEQPVVHGLLNRFVAGKYNLRHGYDTIIVSSLFCKAD